SDKDLLKPYAKIKSDPHFYVGTVAGSMVVKRVGGQCCADLFAAFLLELRNRNVISRAAKNRKVFGKLQRTQQTEFIDQVQFVIMKQAFRKVLETVFDQVVRD